MDKKDILNSHVLKKRFVKDNNLPITVYDEPYFSERIHTIDCLFNSIAKWELFCKELADFANEEHYLAYYNNVKDEAINHIQSHPRYKSFCDTSLPNSDKTYPHRNLYITENWYKSFISIDMKKANFSAMRLYAGEIFNDAKTWEEFLSEFSTKKHILNSKYIRQVIMGACNPKRQVTYEKWLMTTLYEWIKNQVPGIELYSLAVDEIILVHPSETHSREQANTMVAAIDNALARHVVGKMVVMNEFYLEPLAHYGYCKIDYHNPNLFEFKCVDADTFHQHVKLYRDETITENDLVFYHNGELARYLKPIPNYLNPIASS
jgi:hypothetical protein